MPNTISIPGEEVEVVEDHRYLGVHLDIVDLIGILYLFS